jgi:hypothetical protein
MNRAQLLMAQGDSSWLMTGPPANAVAVDRLAGGPGPSDFFQTQ